MCYAIFPVCPSITTHSTCQFWASSEPVNLPKTKSQAKSGVRAVIRFLYSEQATRNVVLRYCPSSWQCSAAYCRCNKEACEEFDHPPSSARTWLPVIFISFLIWNGDSDRGTKFWHNELQTSVEKWLKAQVAGFYDESIENLVPHYKKCLCRRIDYVEK